MKSHPIPLFHMAVLVRPMIAYDTAALLKIIARIPGTVLTADGYLALDRAEHRVVRRYFSLRVIQLIDDVLPSEIVPDDVLADGVRLP